MADKEGSIELDITFKQAMSIPVIITITYFLYTSTNLYTTLISLTTIILITGVLMSTSIGEKLGANNILDILILIILAPVYPFKKMLEYREIENKENQSS